MIQYEMELGYSNDIIVAGPYSVSLRTVQRMRRSFQKYGLVYVESSDAGGRPKALDSFHIQELKLYLDQRPSAYLDEMVFFLHNEFGLQVTESTVFRTLKELG